MSPERSNQFKIMLSDDELAMLRALAERDGLTASDVLRQFIRRSHAEAFGDKKPRKKRKR